MNAQSQSLGQECHQICSGTKASIRRDRSTASGTAYFSALCQANGIECSHETYFTQHGPRLRNPRRKLGTTGDVSWLAPPFLPDGNMIILHQVRNPLKVVNSIHRIGFFQPNPEPWRRPYLDIARRHFNFSDDPLQTAMRFYVEWNEMCEALTTKRYRVEDLESERHRIANWIGVNLDNLATVSTKTNAREAQVDETVTLDILSSYPEYTSFQEIAVRYGYQL